MQAATHLGGAALVATALGYDALLAWLRRIDRGFDNPTENTWWFGYARDIVNLLGAVGYAAGFFLLGFPGPIAMLAAGLLTILTYTLDYVFGRALGVRSAALALGATLVGVTGGLIIWRAQVATGLHDILETLFP